MKVLFPCKYLCGKLLIIGLDGVLRLLNTGIAIVVGLLDGGSNFALVLFQVGLGLDNGFGPGLFLGRKLDLYVLLGSFRQVFLPSPLSDSY